MANVLCSICKINQGTRIYDGREVCDRCYLTAPEIVQARIASSMGIPTQALKPPENSLTFYIGGPDGSISSDGQSVTITGAKVTSEPSKEVTMGLMKFIGESAKKAKTDGTKKEPPPLRPKRRFNFE